MTKDTRKTQQSHTPCLATTCRFQSALPGERQQVGVFGALAAIARREGPRALYKGFVPKALRLGIGQSVGLVAFQQLLRTFGVSPPLDALEPEHIATWE
jgi:hypothetical protein